MTPVKDQKTPNSKLAGRSKTSENGNPNSALPTSTPPSKTKSKRPASGVSHRAAPVAMQGRKFLVAKKNSKKEASLASMASLTSLDRRCDCKEKQNWVKKCRCVAYESLRASQEEFFKNRAMAADEGGKEIAKTEGEVDGVVRSESDEVEDSELSPHITSSRIRKIKNRLMQEARSSIPDFGCGRVKHLTNAFERLLSIRKSGGGEDEDKAKLESKWALPGMQGNDPESTDLSSSTGSLPPPDFVFTAKPAISSSFDSSKR